MNIFKFIPLEYERLAPDFETEMRDDFKRLSITGLLMTATLYALFSLADYWFYPEVAQLLLIPRWLFVMIWYLIAALFYWRKDFRPIYQLSLSAAVVSALLTESLLIISRDPTGP